MIEELKTKYQNCDVHFICTDKEGKPVSGQHLHAISIEWDDYNHELIIMAILGKNTVSFLDLMEIDSEISTISKSANAFLIIPTSR